MKSNSNSSSTRRRHAAAAFTLIELLVVIAIIAVLAGLIFAVMPAVHGSKTRSMAKAELSQIGTALEAFKGRYGFYPQDSRNPNKALTPLYLELVGTIRSGSAPSELYQTLDKRYTVNAPTLKAQFGIDSLVNSSTSAQGTDDKLPPEIFLKELKPNQITLIAGVPLLGSAIEDGLVWNYNSSNPTNNPGGYDLWLDVIINGKTNRIGNF